MLKVSSGLILHRRGNIRSKKIKNLFDRFMSFTPMAIFPQEKPAAKARNKKYGNYLGL